MQLAHHHLDGELGIFLTPLQQGLAGFRTERLARAFVFARLAVERVKSLVAPKIIPAFQCGSRIAFAAPGPFAGQSGGSGQGEVLLYSLLDPARGGVPGQGQSIGIGWWIHNAQELPSGSPRFEY